MQIAIYTNKLKLNDSIAHTAHPQTLLPTPAFNSRPDVGIYSYFPGVTESPLMADGNVLFSSVFIGCSVHGNGPLVLWGFPSSSQPEWSFWLDRASAFVTPYTLKWKCTHILPLECDLRESIHGNGLECNAIKQIFFSTFTQTVMLTAFVKSKSLNPVTKVTVRKFVNQ